MPDVGTVFIGRAVELDEVDRVIRDLHVRAASVVVSGPPGIGKTAFLDQIEAMVAARSMQVVATTPAESEVSIPYAGLQLLIQPHLASLRASLPGATTVLERCVIDAGESGLGTVAMALVQLLEELAEAGPLLVRVDDVQWLDQPSFDAVVFAVRRLADSPIACVFGVRDESPRHELALRAGFADLPIPAMDRAEARELLSRRASWLGPQDADSVLHQAAGNALALVELPRALMRATNSVPASGPSIPLISRLEDAFAERQASLPKAARDLLLVMASSDRDSLDEILAAVAHLPGWGHTEPEQALDVARHAGLVHVRDRRIAFEHPLVRSAIYQRASVAQRETAHRALSAVLDHEPARQVWHRASSTTDLDDELASALVDTARHLSAAGDEATAFAALKRAARTATDPRRRAALSVDAMHEGLALGRPDLVAEMLATIDGDLLDDLDSNRLAWLREITRNGTYSGAARLTALAAIARRISEAPLCQAEVRHPASCGVV
jgi:AAA ATPase domain